jgi:AraC family transcriptional regulator of adaptative response/methylated-DNA-[protein]-cysteine methyltransferase
MKQTIANSQETGGAGIWCIYNESMQNKQHYELIARAIEWVANHQSQQPELETLAVEMGVSPYHLQRTFQAWAGVSPKQFLKSLTRRAAVERLVSGSNVLDTAISIGLSGPGRLHDLLITTEALTPGEIRQRGAGVALEYGFGETPFGRALLAWSSRGLNFLGFCHDRGAQNTLAELQALWLDAIFVERPDQAQARLNAVFAASHDQPIRLWLRGSPFQLKVWEALLAIPEGSHASYGALARYVGQPAAARAVGSAVGANPLAWIIPCHRVIRQVGELGGYRWGTVTKQAMIGFEAARARPSGFGSQAGQIHVNV